MAKGKQAHTTRKAAPKQAKKVIRKPTKVAAPAVAHVQTAVAGATHSPAEVTKAAKGNRGGAKPQKKAPKRAGVLAKGRKAGKGKKVGGRAAAKK